MRPIKFRGRVPDSDKLDGGKIVFGSLVDYGDNWSHRYWINPIGGDRNFPVEENSIAQLVGVDKNGAEVYEGDTIEFNGCTYSARLEEYWAGDIPAGELCSAIQDVIHTLRPVRLWQESIVHVIRIEGEDSPSLPVHRKKLAEAYPPFKTACERFIAAYQDFTKELEATK